MLRPGHHHTISEAGLIGGWQQVSWGIYIARLTTIEYAKSIKMLLLK